MKVFSILLILLLAYIAVSDASPSPQSPGIDDITSFGRDKRDIDGPTYFTKWLESTNIFGGTRFAARLLLRFLAVSLPVRHFNRLVGMITLRIRGSLPLPIRLFLH
ncbi:uncharacterized protein LOC123682471 isoform X7 [Harmonia axyridis]|uniref:uncharacterized protein LOC123682471 isoform X7 n=1 Tax=Harmonia axyridis TaxID=115357 RepID=UPI001E279B60|nr:uncharacterized protein LOC123682471 isoform X7 [Harmonia axyridis]